MYSASNVTGEGEILKISPIPEYLIYDSFKKDLDVVLVYERILDSTKVSDMYSNALTFLLVCMIGQWRFNDKKTFLPQSQFFGMLPPEARSWAYTSFVKLLAIQNMGVTANQNLAQ